MSSQGQVVGRVMPPLSPNIAGFNMCECLMNEEKKGYISKMNLRIKLDVCSLSDRKMKRRCKVMLR